MHHGIANGNPAGIGRIVEPEEDQAKLDKCVKDQEIEGEHQRIFDHGRAFLTLAAALRNGDHCTRSRHAPRRGTVRGMPVNLNNIEAVAVVIT